MNQIMGWRVAYEISSNRHSTKKGKDHLTEHGFDVLTDRVNRDNNVMTAMMMSTFGFLTK